MHVFISHRRTKGHRPSPLASSIYSEFEKLAGRNDRVILDMAWVSDQDEFSFATRLVDQGLNLADALVIVLEDNWFSDKNLIRLISSANVEKSDDWVEFEIRYGLVHQLAVVLVGEARCLRQVDGVELPYTIHHLKAKPRFETDGSTIDSSLAKDLWIGLRKRCAEDKRLPSTLVADDSHNRPHVRKVFRYSKLSPNWVLNLEFGIYVGFAVWFVGMILYFTFH